MLATFIVSTIVLVIAISFLFTKYAFLKDENTHVKSLLELAEAERDLLKYMNKSLKESKTDSLKPTAPKKKYYKKPNYKKPTTKKTEE